MKRSTIPGILLAGLVVGASSAQDNPADQPRVLWRMPLECSVAGLPDCWWATYDYSRLAKGQDRPAEEYWESLCPDLVEVVDAPDVPGGKAIRFSGPVSLATTSAGSGEGSIDRGRCIMFSALMKAEREGVEAVLVMGDRTPNRRTVRLSAQWKRYAVVARWAGGRWNPFRFGITGTKAGTFWAAAPLLEHPRPAREARAAHWERTDCADYVYDTGTVHSGRRSVRLDGTAVANAAYRPSASQEIAFAAPPRGKMVVTGWCKASALARDSRGRARGALLAVELYGPPREFVMTEAIEKLSGARRQQAIERETARLKGPLRTLSCGPGQAGEWELLRVEFDPRDYLGRSRRRAAPAARAALRRVRIVLSNAADGAGWFDDLRMAEDGRNADLVRNGGFESADERLIVSHDTPPAEYGRPRRFSQSDHHPRPPEARCPLVQAQPVVDGKLDDPCWRQAAAFEGLREIEAGAPAHPSVRARLCRDDGHLYAAYRWDFAADPYNDASKARPRQEGETQPDGPVVGVLIRPRLLHPGRAFFDFAVNAKGEKREGKGFEHRFGVRARKFFLDGFDKQGWGFYEEEFAKPWQAKVGRTGSVFTAEIAVPISSVELDHDGDVWGVNLWAKTGDGKTFAWSVPHQAKLPGKLRLQSRCNGIGDLFYGALWDHHVCRTKGTDHFYGICRGMAGMRAAAPYEGMVRVAELSLEPLPDRSLGVAARIVNAVGLKQGPMDVKVEACLLDRARIEQLRKGGLSEADTRDAHQVALEMDMQRQLYGVLNKLWRHGRRRAVAVEGLGRERVVHLSGFGLKWADAGKYNLRVAVTTPDGRVALGGEERVIGLDGRLSPALARASIRVQYSLYVEDKSAKVLVRSRLAEDARAAFCVVDPQGGRRPVRALGDALLRPGESRFVEIAADDLPVGRTVIECTFTGGSGKALAFATDEVHRRPPSPYGYTRLNRITGCLLADGRAVILRTGVSGHGVEAPPGGGADYVAPRKYGFNCMVGFPEAGETHWRIPWLHNHQLNDQVVAGLVAKIRQNKHRKGIVAWKLVDEPTGGPAICETYWKRSPIPLHRDWSLKLARQEDPYHPQFIVSGPIDTDIKVSGGYPFGLGRLWATPWNYTLDFHCKRVAYAGSVAREKGLPIHTWLSFVRGHNSVGRMPTLDEMRGQICALMIHGCRNLMYWCGRCIHRGMLERIGQVHGEVDAFEAFLGRPGAYPVAIGVQDDVHYALWKAGQGLCLLLVNEVSNPVTSGLEPQPGERVRPDRAGPARAGRADREDGGPPRREGPRPPAGRQARRIAGLRRAADAVRRVGARPGRRLHGRLRLLPAAGGGRGAAGSAGEPSPLHPDRRVRSRSPVPGRPGAGPGVHPRERRSACGPGGGGVGSARRRGGRRPAGPGERPGQCPPAALPGRRVAP